MLLPAVVVGRSAAVTTLSKDSWQKTISVQDDYFDQNNKRYL
jgi:hypothetical protein